MHILHGQGRRSPTSDQRLDGCNHLVPAGGNSRLALAQVDGPTGESRSRLAFGGHYLQWMWAHKNRCPTDPGPRWPGLLYVGDPEVGLGVLV